MVSELNKLHFNFVASLYDSLNEAIRNKDFDLLTSKPRVKVTQNLLDRSVHYV